jgi:outer membrane biosynthesis protein TonB
LLLTIAAACGAWAADNVVMLRYGPDRSGLPQRFLAPEYPKQALERHITGYVDVEGLVGGSRLLSEPSFRAGSPEAEVFVPAVRAAAANWTFYPAYPGNGCFPVPTRMGLRVIFELEHDQPKISIEVPKAPPKRENLPPPRCNKPRYPSDALRNQESGIVYTRVNVMPDGLVSSVETDVYPRHGSFLDDAFSDAVKSAMSTCRFEATADSRPRAACFDVVFNIRDSVLY